MVEERTQIIDLLKRLKNEYGAVAIKAEFEAEGARKDELIMLREFLYQVELDFVIKIGGCEAVHDLDQCRLLNANGIMAPMIETPFAMSKYRNAANKVYGSEQNHVEWIINAETITCLQNYREILQNGEGFVSAVTVGRSDLSASMGIARDKMEDAEVYEATRALLVQSKQAGLITNFGGNIGLQSVDFIIRMSDVADRFETRKVVLKPSNDAKKIEEAIKAALQFELEYLLYKAKYYSKMAVEDEDRIRRLRSQLEN